MGQEAEFSHLRTAVIGVGSMGQNHARVYNEISDLVAVADPSEEQGRVVAERFGVAWHGDCREMLGAVDAVTVAVPTAMHREVAEAVAAAGVHLLVEKPLAGNVADAEAIVAAAKAAGVILAVGHVERHNPVVGFAHEALQRGEWGQIITMASRRVSNYPARVKDVGVVFDLAIHDLDVMQYLSGAEIQSVYALGGRSSSTEYEDHITLLLEFASGKEGICEANWLTPMKVRQLILTCSTHYVELNYINQSVGISTSHFVDLDEGNLFLAALEVERRQVALTKREPLKNELVDFLEAASKGKEPLVTGEDGLKTIKAAHAALESLGTKQRIIIEN